MVVCIGTMPPETRQQPAIKKELSELIDSHANLELVNPVESGVAEDREEGEIEDEFELIISSEDEEFKLRARIQQLEENNKDVERMDMLSANLAHQYNYPKPMPRLPSYQQNSPIYILSDVSSQSENEYEAQRKFRKHKMRRVELSKRQNHSVHNEYRRNPLGRRHKHASPPPPVTTHRRRQGYHHHQPSNHHQHRHQQHFALEDSLDSITDDELGEYDMNIENEDDEIDIKRLKLSRDKLREALAREERQYDISQYKSSLRDRLQYRLPKAPSPKNIREYPQEKELPLSPLQILSDGGEDEPEQEQPQSEDSAELKLRLIALKSAILKKHLARKKRDAERAYSPTDMINRVHPVISNDEDIDDLMEISPAASPEREQSSPRYSTEYAVDTKPVDMELAETDSDDQNKDAWNPWSNNWNTMDNAGGSWRCFLPNNLPPVSVPIVIDEDDEDDIKTHDIISRENRAYDYDDDEIPPPPPPFHIPHMHLEDDDARDAMHLVDQHSNNSYNTEIQSVSMENSQTQVKSFDQFHPESSDDEAGALRAILLSNLRAIKPPPPPPDSPPPPDTSAFVSVPSSVADPFVDSVKTLVSAPLSTPLPDLAPVSGSIAQLKEESNQENDSDDPEVLRLLLLSSIANKKRVSSVTQHSSLSPKILKNAVKRFQSTGLPIKDEQSQDQHPNLEEITELKTENKTLNEAIVEPIALEAGPIQMASVESPQPVLKPTIQAKELTSPSTKIIKIVKPNKVINKKTTTKRKLPINEEAGSVLSVKRPSALMIKEPSAPLHGLTAVSSNTRLITTVDPASIKVNKLVISLAEESAASDDDLELSSCYAYVNTDIASPLSLVMGGFSGSTTRSNTPISEIVETTPSANNNLRRTVINEYFEKKIDDFLKQARSKAPASNSPEETIEQIPEKPKVDQKQPTIITTPKIQPAHKTTPVAVRHLPVASQKEYLRLVERMQLLEQKKVQAAKSVAPLAKSKVTVVKPSSKNNSPPTASKVNNSAKTILAQAKNTTTMTTKATSTAVNPQEKTTDIKSQKTKAKPIQLSKESRLKAFENSFNKIGGSMLVNLDKSLEMVEEAKKSKAIRLRCSQRLKELYAEMQIVRQAVKQEELKLARIQPEIQSSHEIIISLKQKRHKLHTAAMDLGRGLMGKDYRLLDEGKAAITSKSTELTKQIRLYNSIVKYEDLKKLTDAELSQPNTVIETGPNTDQPENPKDIEELNPQEPHSLEPSTDPGIGDQHKTETEPAIGNEPEAETKTPDDQAQDMTIGVDIKTAAPYTVTTMRELRDERANELYGKSYLSAYQTPMSRNYNSHLDVHATICPFDLMGRCEDTDCSYLHLARPDLQNELPKTNLSHNN
ncbi:uncharacterized protein LOC108112893 [Drosophila eugracilis]|uniref:uncharacterized protein LOC108112893 n=1 Tax=Drosophila eugracilis TaxID=29029 RepID=UPI0007E848BC|nr:uncharacterized protein LOC108112893 [Drosophila eugracilis]